MSSKSRILLGAVAIILFLAAWEYAGVEARPKSPPDPPVVHPQQGDSPTPISVKSLLPGTISAVYVSLHSYVRTGQAMALVDSDVLRARLEETKQDLEMQRSAEINAETAAESLQAQCTNAQSYQTDAESEVSSAQSAAADARSVLDHRDELFRAGAVPLDARSTAERSYDEARNAVAAAQARLSEVSQLVDQAHRGEDAASRKVEQAKTEVERCERAVAEAEAAFGRRWILAPADGSVVRVNAQIGQAAAVGPQAAPLFVIQPDSATGASGETIPRRE